MAGKITLTGETAREYCKKFPDTPTMTLAKKMYAENKSLFSTLHHARTTILYVRGQKGKKARKNLLDKSLMKPLEYKYNPFDLPESFATPYEPFILSQSRTLIISDLHIPYQDNKAITAALNYGLEKNVNCILINGDLIDFHFQSRFEKDARKRSTKQEFDAARQFLKGLRDAFPKTRIIFKEGNHDERWEKWLYVKAPELFDDTEFKLEVRLRLAELRIEIVKDKLPISIGKLTLMHGHELNGGGGVNPARGLFLKTCSSMAIGHLHRTSRHAEPIFMGDTVVTNSFGCLCDLYPEYARVNKWNHGFGYCELDLKTGEYNLLNLTISKDGKVFV